MTDRLPLPAELFRATRGPVGVDGQSNGVVHQLMGLADRGDYVQAAGQAAELLRGNVNDVRLASIYLMGSFVERGAAALPDVLARVEMMLGDVETSRLVDSALAWLFRALTDQIAFHTTQRGETWNAWLREITAQHVDEIAVRSDSIAIKAPGGAGSLNKLSRWAREKLGPAAARVVKPEPDINSVLVERTIDLPPAPTGPGWDEADDHDHEAAPAPEPEPDDEPDDDEDDDDEPDDDDEFGDASDSGARFRDDERSQPARALPRSRAPVGRLPSPPSSEFEAPALTQLRDKLRGFEVLVERGDLDKAAVIARDIQAVLDDFDPIKYLPSLFARYLKLLNGNFGELEQRWAGEDTRAWRVLVQLYQADLDSFLDD